MINAPALLPTENHVVVGGGRHGRRSPLRATQARRVRCPPARVPARGAARQPPAQGLLGV